MGGAPQPEPAATASAPTRRRRLGGPELGLIVVLVLGAVLRLWLVYADRPGFLGYPDAQGYVEAALLSGRGLLFYNQYRPAGYPMFLVVLHALDASLTFAIVVQHLLGLLAAAALYFSVRRFVQTRWVALLPAAVVALSGSELYLEHSALSDSLYACLVIGAVWCAGRSVGLDGRSGLAWLLGAGLLGGAAVPVRSVGLFVALAIVGWAAATRRGGGVRIACAAAVTLGIVLTLGSYLVYQHGETGTWGLTRTTGETLYARTAIFADCRDFTPPQGTAGLCQPAGGVRLGPTQYMFDPSEPLYKAFGPPPDPRAGGSYKWPPDGKLESFAIAAITHQPLTYLSTTLQGVLKYVAPHLGTPTMLEWNQPILISELPNPQIQATAAPLLAQYYPGEHPTVHSLSTLDTYADDAKVEGPVTAILLILMLAGWVLTRGPDRVAAALYGWVTTALIVAPVALLFYGVRYATPAYGPLAAGAALGLDRLLQLARSRRPTP